MGLNEKILAYFSVNSVPPSMYKKHYLTGVHNDGPEEILQWNTEVLGDIPSQEALDAAKAQFDLAVNTQKIRENRNSLLAETDWWASSDLTMTQEQIAYRQALRDITAQEGFPFNVTWPIKP